MNDQAQKAIDLICSHCRSVGAFHGSGEPYIFLRDAAARMRAAKPTRVFPNRYVEHVAYAVDTVASNIFLSPPAAVASVYLVTRFEFYFRALSGKLNDDGTWVSASEQQAATSAIDDWRLKKKQVSSVSLAYKVMKIGTARLARCCETIDNELHPSPIIASGGVQIANVGDRIEFGRNSAGHGHWGDISAEAVFYGLLTTLVFYTQDQS